MKRLIITTLLCLFLESCSNFSNNDSNNLVARAGENFLYEDDLPNYVSSDDSLIKISNFIETWAKEKVLYDLSIINLSQSKRAEIDELINNYRDADILFLHLNNYDAFEKVLPSKIFEYAATGKPILAGVTGYAAKFIQEKIENAEVFYPGDHFSAINAIKRLKIVHTDRKAFISKYARYKIMELMSASIYNIARN